MLTLVGAGLSDWKDISLRGMEVIENADAVYIELYTSVWKGKDELAERIGKEIVELGREDLEQGSGKIIDEATEKDVVVLVPGDPMIATTHSSVLKDAVERGVEVNIIHNASIVSAIGETGLHAYKFGATVTVPFPEKTGNQLPESVYETLRMNGRNGLHTLMLMDITTEKRMSADQAIQILLDIEEKRKEGVFTGDTDVIVLTRAGSADSVIYFGKASDMMGKDFGEPPMVLIVPGILHFSEKDYLLLIGSEI